MDVASRILHSFTLSLTPSRTILPLPMFLLRFGVNGEGEYSLLGFTSVYEYFVMPDRIRPRIRYVLFCPPKRDNNVFNPHPNAIRRHGTNQHLP